VAVLSMKVEAVTNSFTLIYKYDEAIEDVKHSGITVWITVWVATLFNVVKLPYRVFVMLVYELFSVDRDYMSGQYLFIAS
jgi:hypothetical protein